MSLLPTTLMCLAAAAPFVVAGLHRSRLPGYGRLILWSVFVLALTNWATGLDAIFGIHQSDSLQWNWIGKLACLAVIVLLEFLLPVGTLRGSGMLGLPVRDSWVAVSVSLFVCALIGGSAALAPQLQADPETLAYQAFIPSVTEEPVFRVMLPLLLMATMGSPWQIGKARMGWWWLATSIVFGTGHAIQWSASGVPSFEVVPFVFTGIVALWLGWLAVRCNSIWPCLLGHTLLNVTGRVIVAAANVLAANH